MKKSVSILFILLSIIISWCIIEIVSSSPTELKECNLSEKYLPRNSKVLEGERVDFIKAIWENETIQDWHIVIDDCEAIEFYPSSKIFYMPYEHYIKIHNRIINNMTLETRNKNE